VTVVAAIPIGSRLVDTVASLGLATLRSMKRLGIDGVIAYLGGNLTPELLSDCHTVGMGVVPVNFSHKEGWIPSTQLGQADAEASIRHLSTLACPTEGLYDWCDLEGAGGDPTGYLRAWGSITADQGRKAGLYVGAGGLLTGPQLYSLPDFTGYWRSLSRGIPEPQCGYLLSQLYRSAYCAGTLVDYDYAQEDFEGRSATWLVGE